MDAKTLCRRAGAPAQLYGVRRTTLEEGPGKGAALLEVHTAGGLQLDILPDAGLDIGQLRYKGVNISYMSKNGYDSPFRIQTFDSEFLNTFPAGMLYTCGLRNAGPGNRDGGEWHPHHGRYHAMPAAGLCAAADEEAITISGAVRESALFGHVLQLRRTITVPAFGSAVYIRDVLENLTPRPAEFMLLYHVNFGWPMLSEHAVLKLPGERRTTPRTAFAETALGCEHLFTSPMDDEEEQVYFHLVKPTEAALENPEQGLRAALSWSADTLPILAQWRSMASGDYALGLEPSNCYIMGRRDERANGTLPVLEPFGRREMALALELSTL